MPHSFHEAWLNFGEWLNWTRDALRETAPFFAAVVWPAAAVLAALLLRHELRKLLGRMTKGPYGTEFAQQLERLKRNDVETVTPAQLEAVRTKEVKGWEQQIRQFPLVKDAPTADTRNDILTTLAARAIVSASYERINSLLFGTQVSLLQYLDGKTSGDTAETLTHLFYADAVRRFPELAAGSFEQYMNFLLTANLVEFRNNQYFLTQTGQDFLKWRRSVGLGAKPYG